MLNKKPVLSYVEKDAEFFKERREKARDLAWERAPVLASALENAWEMFCFRLKYPRGMVHMNYAALSKAAVSFWDDMLRLKSYNDLTLYPDRHKVAAHIFKWISRMRPIKAGNDHARELRTKEFRANAFFAVACACCFLEMKENFTSEEYKYITHASLYRDIHAREWSMIFYLLEQLHSKQKASAEA